MLDADDFEFTTFCTELLTKFASCWDFTPLYMHTRYLNIDTYIGSYGRPVTFIYMHGW